MRWLALPLAARHSQHLANLFQGPGGVAQRPSGCWQPLSRTRSDHPLCPLWTIDGQNGSEEAKFDDFH